MVTGRVMQMNRTYNPVHKELSREKHTPAALWALCSRKTEREVFILQSKDASQEKVTCEA